MVRTEYDEPQMHYKAFIEALTACSFENPITSYSKTLNCEISWGKKVNANCKGPVLGPLYKRTFTGPQFHKGKRGSGWVMWIYKEDVYYLGGSLKCPKIFRFIWTIDGAKHKKCSSKDMRTIAELMVKHLLKKKNNKNGDVNPLSQWRKVTDGERTYYWDIKEKKGSLIKPESICGTTRYPPKAVDIIWGSLKDKAQSSPLSNTIGSNKDDGESRPILEINKEGSGLVDNKVTSDKAEHPGWLSGNKAVSWWLDWTTSRGQPREITNVDRGEDRCRENFNDENAMCMCRYTLLDDIRESKWTRSSKHKNASIDLESLETKELKKLLNIYTVADSVELMDSAHKLFKKKVCPFLGKPGGDNKNWKTSIIGMAAHRTYHQLFKIQKKKN